MSSDLYFAVHMRAIYVRTTPRMKVKVASVLLRCCIRDQNPPPPPTAVFFPGPSLPSFHILFLWAPPHPSSAKPKRSWMQITPDKLLLLKRDTPPPFPQKCCQEVSRLRPFLNVFGGSSHEMWARILLPIMHAKIMGKRKKGVLMLLFGKKNLWKEGKLRKAKRWFSDFFSPPRENVFLSFFSSSFLFKIDCRHSLFFTLECVCAREK